MTVYHKIATIRVKDPNRPTRELLPHAIRIGGIDLIPLQTATGIKESTIKLVCSDRHPSTPRTMEDIDRLLSESNIKILREMSSHKNDPVSNGNAKHQLVIETILDDPAAPNWVSESRANNIRDESITKEQLMLINEKRKFINKNLADEDKIKLIDENKTSVKIGEVEKQ